VSAVSGAVAGLAGAFVSHPADLILTLTSSKKKKTDNENDEEDDQGKADWKPIFDDLLSKEGGVLNLYAGFPARATFFFLSLVYNSFCIITPRTF